LGFKIKTTSYRETGKWYTSKTMVLLGEHKYMMGFDLISLIRKNDESVHVYSGLERGFSGGYYHVIEVEYPDEVNNFCNRLIDMTKEMG